MTRRGLRRTVTSLAALGLVAGATVTAAGPAYASPAPPRIANEGDRACRTGEVCLFDCQWQPLMGPCGQATFYYDQPHHDKFWFHYGNGSQGKNVKNHAQAVSNEAVYSAVRIYYWQEYNRWAPSGPSQCFPPQSYGNLNATMRNNNVSHRFLGGSNCS